MKTQFKDCFFDVVIDFVAFVPQHIDDIYTIFNDRISQYIFISSATVYQKPHTILPITENSPRGNPYWKYAQEKVACEELCERVHSKNFPVTIVRPSHTFGKTWIPSAIHHSDFTVASRILNKKPIVIHGTGESMWTLTAVSDFTNGLLGLIGNNHAYGEAFHITSDEHFSWNDIYVCLGEVLGVKPVVKHVPVDFLIKLYPELSGPLLGDKAENGIFDNAKIKKFVPGFVCKKTLQTAFLESVQWFREDNSRMVIDKNEDEKVEMIIRKWEDN